MDKQVYEGWLRHRRFNETEHSFQYNLFMILMKLSELPQMFDQFRYWSYERPNLAWFRRKDHIGNPDVDLDSTIRQKIETETGRRPEGPIYLLTHLRYFGICFNPISVYYCLHPENQSIECLVSEVHNTPWGERHCYVLDAEEGQTTEQGLTFYFDKDMHVSPYMPMNMDYELYTSFPGESLTVHMNSYGQENREFDATLKLEKRPFDESTLNSMLWKYPMMTVKVLGAIYWEAFRLWWKDAQFHSHPGYDNSEGS